MTAQSDAYTAVFDRDREGYWLVELREEPRVHSFGRTLGKARTNILDAAKLWFERDVTLTEDIRLPQAVKRTLARAQRERARVAEVQTAASSSARQAAHALVEEAHLPLRDAAALLGLSHQRVQQLLAS